ncbi:MAG: GyrI-like domain-containing protein [Actinomycetota bacterium]
MSKLDFKILRPTYFKAKPVFTEVRFPTFKYLMIDGRGDPNTSESFKNGVEALFGVAYTIKFVYGKANGQDFVVAPLEALWWADDWSDFKSRNKERWYFTLMIMVPDWVTKKIVAQAVDSLKQKKSNPTMAEPRLDKYSDGKSVQVLHVGSYDNEGPVLAALHGEYLPLRGLEPTGKHHEIYLNDFRRTQPARLKTILRQPVRKLSH